MIASIIALTIIPLLSASLVHAASTSHAPISINGNTQLAAASNGGGDGTAGNPYIIENYVISASSANGIVIQNTTAYFIVRNCLVENGGSTYHGIYAGIYLDNVVNGKIENNTCSNNGDGISLWYSPYNNLTNNTCENNTYSGISLWYSSYNNLTNNTCENNNTGIYPSGSSNDNLTNNTCSNNTWNGFFLNGSSNDNLTNNTCNNNHNGISLNGVSIDNTTGSTCENNNLTNNTCSNNNMNGILLNGFSNVNRTNNNCNNILTNNTCENNNYGIYLGGSDNNRIYHNNFINNSTQAYDNDANYWDNGYPSGGNYWSDWQSPDADNNGIVDNPRTITGGTNQDHYPLIALWTPSWTPPSALTRWPLIAVIVGAIVVIGIVAVVYMRRR